MKFPNENLAKPIDGAEERIVADFSQIFPGHCLESSKTKNTLSFDFL